MWNIGFPVLESTFLDALKLFKRNFLLIEYYITADSAKILLRLINLDVCFQKFDKLSKEKVSLPRQAPVHNFKNTLLSCKKCRIIELSPANENKLF